MRKIYQHLVAAFLLSSTFLFADLSAQSNTIAINCGGSATGTFAADNSFSGGNTYTTSAQIDMSQITSNVPPSAIFNSERYGVFTYTLSVGTAGNQATVTLYFTESYVTGAGQRKFDVSINGTKVLSNFDIYATAGGQNKAIARTFTTTGNSSGQVVIQFSSITENPKINGITVSYNGVAPSKISGNQVIVIGESFIAMSHLITQDLQQLAVNAGILASGDKFIDNSVSGTRLSGGPSPNIPLQYANGNSQKKVRWVIMDGGGNDCLGGSCPNPPTPSCPDLQNAVNAARTLIAKMGSDGVVKVLYFFYPDPQQDFGGLRAKLDVLRPLIQNVVTSSTNPKCYWLDLRPVFQGHYAEYIQSDGIHPTPAGCQATANAIWNVIQQNNFFNIPKSEPAIAESMDKNMSGVYIYPSPASEKVMVVLPTTPESEVSMHIYNITGMQVKQVRTNEKATNIDISGLAKGIYHLVIDLNHKTIVEKFIKQ